MFVKYNQMSEVIEDKEVHIHRKIRFHATIASVCAIMAYIGYNNGFDPLGSMYGMFTGYAWSHFFMYMLMGFINFFGETNPYEHALLLSFVWEYLEIFFGLTTGTLHFWTSGGITGQMQDIVMNMSGFTIGHKLRKIMPCKLKNCSSKLLIVYEVAAVVVVTGTLVRFKLKNS